MPQRGSLTFLFLGLIQTAAAGLALVLTITAIVLKLMIILDLGFTVLLVVTTVLFLLGGILCTASFNMSHDLLIATVVMNAIAGLLGVVVCLLVLHVHATDGVCEGGTATCPSLWTIMFLGFLLLFLAIIIAGIGGVTASRQQNPAPIQDPCQDAAYGSFPPPAPMLIEPPEPIIINIPPVQKAPSISWTPAINAMSL